MPRLTYRMLKPYPSARLLFEEAVRRGLEPRWESSTGLFSVGSGTENFPKQYIYYTASFGNSQEGAVFCKDKFLMRAFLEREGFPNIPYLVTSVRREAADFLREYEIIIQKPVRGERAIGVRLIRDPANIDYENLTESMFEKYVSGPEWRCFLVGGRVVAQQQKISDPIPKYPWRKRIKNVPSGAWLQTLTDQSERIAKLLRMELLAVDFIVAGDTHYILECNSMPGLYSFHHPDEGEPMNLVGLVLSYLLEHQPVR